MMEIQLDCHKRRYIRTRHKQTMRLEGDLLQDTLGSVIYSSGGGLQRLYFADRDEGGAILIGMTWLGLFLSVGVEAQCSITYRRNEDTRAARGQERTLAEDELCA